MSLRVDQALDIFAFGDAISNEARAIQERLHERGMASTIFARVIGSDVTCPASEFRSAALDGADAVIYHYATGSTVGRAVALMSLPSALIYHNITPPPFFAPFDPAVASVLEQGVEDLASIAAGYTRLLADSAFSASELSARTGRPASVLPVAANYARFSAVASGRGRRAPRAGAHWLTVGRVAPNKGLRRLVAAFAAALTLDPTARLTIAGSYRATDAFHLALRFEIARLGIIDRVTLTGSIADDALLACYADADVYITLSEHEGFCVPLVEAMASDLPILASTSTAIPETLGIAGLMVEDDASPEEIAALASIVCGDAELRDQIVAAGRERVRAFGTETIGACIDRVVDDLLRTRQHKDQA